MGLTEALRYFGLHVFLCQMRKQKVDFIQCLPKTENNMTWWEFHRWQWLPLCISLGPFFLGGIGSMIHLTYCECMCACTSMHVWMGVHVCMCTYIHTNTCMCMFPYVCVCLHACMLCAWMYVFVCIHVCICMCAFVYMAGPPILVYPPATCTHLFPTN